MKRRPIIYKDVTYPSIAALARKFRMNESTVRARLASPDYNGDDLIDVPIGYHPEKPKKTPKPPERTPDGLELIKPLNEIWKVHHLIPNMNSRRGLYG